MFEKRDHFERKLEKLMIEFLFLLAFTLVLFMTGISLIGIMLAMLVGFAVMAFAGMMGLLFKMLPWIILIAIVIWVFRGRDSRAKKCRDFFSKGTRGR